MKPAFFDYMLKIMRENKDVYFIFCDLGFPRVEEFLNEFPDRAYNFGASEQTCMDAAVGLAYAGKIPFVYTITPFFYRAFETLRTYINYENLPVKMIAVGVDDDYSKEDGFSHDASDIYAIIRQLRVIRMAIPTGTVALRSIIDEAAHDRQPWFINIKR